MKKTRVIIALIFWAGISLLFVGIPALATWLGWMPKMQFLPSVMALNLITIAVVIAACLVIGRFYCSAVCPLGVMQDVISHVSVLAKRARKNRKPFHFRKEHKWLRYGIWGLFVIAFATGFQTLVALLDPYSAYGRIVNSIFHFKTGPVLAVAAVTLAVVGLLAWFTGREYCNGICPVGTTLSFFSRFAIFRPVIDAAKCKNCKVCENNCKAGCIDIANHKIDYSRCVDCFNCLDNCKFDALQLRNYYRYKKASGTGAEEEPSTAASGRRAFLAGAAMGLAAVTLGAQSKKTDGGFAIVEAKKAIDRETPLTPPGSSGIKDFYSRCTACQLCIAACPNGVLRPSTDIKRLMQPEMGFENGYCRPECTACGDVCPSGAIISITREEKTSYHVGYASIDRELCVAEQGTKCGNCARHCPTGAIQMIDNEEYGNRIPTVDTEVCIGCGACENLCPSRPISAITVNGRHNHLHS